MTVGGGQEWSEQAGGMVNRPQQIFDTQTQQYIEASNSSKTLPPNMSRQVGTSNGKPVYEDAQGNRFIGN